MSFTVSKVTKNIMNKILFAINHSAAEQKVSELISNTENKVVGTVVSQDSVKDFISSTPVDILVFREDLVGEEDDFEFVIKLKMNTPNLRIVFIAGDRSPGDKNLAKLVSYGIYDIIAGQSVKVQEIANKIITPTGFNEAVKYLPNKFMKKGVFSDEDLSDIEDEQNSSNLNSNNTKIETSDLEEPEKPTPQQKPPKTFGMSLKDKLKQKTQKQKPTQENTNNNIKIETEDLSSNIEKTEDLNSNIEELKDEIDNSNDLQNQTIKHIPREEVDPSLPDEINIDDFEEEEDDNIEIEEISYQQRPNQKLDDANKAFNKRVYSASDEELENVKKLLKEQEKKNKQLEKQLKQQVVSSQKALSEKDKLLKSVHDEFAMLEQQFDSNSKQRVVMFYSVMPGVGTSTIALNTATYLALKKYKVAYIEFNEYLPTLAYWYDLSELEEGLENCFLGIESRTYQDIPKNIITKEKILSLKSDLREKHEKYPELLNYLVFSESYINRGEINKVSPNTLKDLMLTLLYKEGYDYVILDMYSHTDHSLLEMASIFSSSNVFVMTQDVVTIGNSLRKFASLEASGLDFEMLNISVANKRKSMEPTENYKNFYVINKFNDSSLFTRKKISAWLNTDKKIITIPENSTEILNSTYKGLPTILISKNKEFVFQIKKLSEII